MDSTITLAFLVTLVSVVSPVITSLINKKYELELRAAEFKKESFSHKYEMMYSTFKNFLDDSTAIMLRFDSGEKPRSQEFKNFESSCLECFLFLNEEERKTFQDFRVHVKVQTGFDDPRPKYNFSNILNLQVSAILDEVYSNSGNKTFVKFNKCVTIANQKLENISEQELKLLSPIRKEYKSTISIRSAFQRKQNTEGKK